MVTGWFNVVPRAVKSELPKFLFILLVFLIEKKKKKARVTSVTWGSQFPSSCFFFFFSTPNLCLDFFSFLYGSTTFFSPFLFHLLERFNCLLRVPLICFSVENLSRTSAHARTQYFSLFHFALLYNPIKTGQNLEERERLFDFIMAHSRAHSK